MSYELVDLLKPLNTDLEALEKQLLVLADGLREPLKGYFLRSVQGGKRIRPVLVFLLGRSLNVFWEDILDLALSIELLHCATLLHDDVIDESLERRNRLQIGASSKKLAILIGDYLLSRSIDVLVGDTDPMIINVYVEALGTICEGEIYQYRGSKIPELTEYYRIIEMKTGKLFEASCHMVGILAGLSDEEVNDLCEFGREFGYIYQIRDDIDDILGNSFKEIAQNGYYNMPLILYRDEYIDEILPLRNDILDKIKKSNAYKDTLSRLEEHRGLAINCIKKYIGQQELNILKDLLDWLIRVKQIHN